MGIMIILYHIMQHIQYYDLYHIVQHIHVQSSHGTLHNWCFAMLQVTQKGNGGGGNFSTS